MKMLCMVKSYGLIPMYESDAALKQRLSLGKVVEVEVSTPRNYEFHKKFFALVRITHDNLPEHLAKQWGIYNEEGMLRKFKRDLGYFESHRNEYNEIEIQLKSISFAKMDQVAFERFYAQCLDLVLNKYLAGITQEELQEELINFK